MENENRKKIYQETKKYYLSKKIPIYESIKYTYSKIGNINNKMYDSKINIYNMDTIDCAIMLKTKYDYSICILNMANPYYAGGGVEKGAIAQEESIFRRSNYFQTLEQTMYPIKNNELIYSPIVDVSRKSEKDLFTFYDKSYQFSFIGACAPINPDISNENYYKYYYLMYNKICHILNIALMNNHDCILLGALGCGAFNNPPHVVACVFKEVLQHYKGCFKEIAFAILKDAYGKSELPDNYDIFRLILL